jgi:predicted GNAT superfamily acetyltransferase
MGSKTLEKWIIKILESPQEMVAVEHLQRLVWPGSELDIVPAHMLLAASHNGGLVIGAYTSGFGSSLDNDRELVGFVFGFPGLYPTPDGPRSKLASHLLGVHPDYRNRGVGFFLKRAQWQMVRHLELDLITWTYDPLLSRNAYLNIARLGAVCNQYRRDDYGEMRDAINIGLPSDRFQVDWWVNSKRVLRRLSRQARLRLDLAHVLSTGARIVNPTRATPEGYPQPGGPIHLPEGEEEPVILVEIPSDFQRLRVAAPELAQHWREVTRQLFEELFTEGYLVTDMIYLPGSQPRSYYVLSYGESTL